MTARELAERLLALPDPDLPAYTIAEFSGLPGTSPVENVKIITSHEESESWYKDDDVYPRIEIT